MKWISKAFDELSLQELYELLALRQEVFVVEQDCPYLDADGKDADSFHVLGYEGDTLAAYARVVFPGVSYAEVAVGRVIVKMPYRGKKLGEALMLQCHDLVRLKYGTVDIRLSAQSHLKSFYEGLNYQPTGKEYLEDGIPHMEMLASLQ